MTERPSSNGARKKSSRSGAVHAWEVRVVVQILALYVAIVKLAAVVILNDSEESRPNHRL
jgi:hypothetical protein